MACRSAYQKVERGRATVAQQLDESASPEDGRENEVHVAVESQNELEGQKPHDGPAAGLEPDPVEASDGA